MTPDGVWVFAHGGPPTEIYLDFLYAYISPGPYASALSAFGSVLLFSVLVLASGRFLNWPPGHFAVPILAWAFKLAADGLEWLAPGMVVEHPLPVVANVLEGAIALVAVVVLISIAAAFQVPVRPGRLDRLFWLSGLLAVATVFIDWMFFLMIAFVPL